MHIESLIINFTNVLSSFQLSFITTSKLLVIISKQFLLVNKVTALLITLQRPISCSKSDSFLTE